MNTGCRMRFYVIKEGSVVSKRHKHNYTAEKTEELTFNQFINYLGNNKNLILKLILQEIKFCLIKNKSFSDIIKAIKLLHKKGYNWPELDIIEKSLNYGK